MAFNLDQELLLRGIGKGYLKTVTNKFVEITSGQNLKLDVSATLEDVYGGDGLFPKYTFISKKEGTIEIDAADFKASQLGISQGVAYTTTSTKKLNRVIVTKASTTLGTGLTGVTGLVVMSSDTGSTINAVQTGTASVGGVKIDATGAITWDTTVPAGEYIVWFKSDSTNAVQASMLKNAMPEISEFNWMFFPEDENGNKYQIDIYARRVRSDGKLAIDTGRDKASVPKMNVRILDPGDGYDDFCVITITKLP